MLVSPSLVLFDFSVEADLSRWYVLDDGVMGGLSQGRMSVSEEGHAVYEGFVSLENNGGFSSLRYRTGQQQLEGQQFAKLRIKGDGKSYQFRVKSSMRERFSYIYTFQTSGEWETVSIPLAEMYPSFRGMRLNMDNYPGEQLAEIAFLIGNKKAEKFRLQIDSIVLE